MSFWRNFGFHPISHIETILDRDSYTLDELLDEDELLQECKLQNQRLIDFLIRPEVLTQLFEYATKEPAEDAERKRKESYPFLASEILCMDISSLIDAIYRDEQFLVQLYDLLNHDVLNLGLASYISKVAINFLGRKTIETLSFIKSQENIVEKFIKHLDKSPIVDILLKIISLEEFQGGAGTLEWLDKEGLISGIVDKFDPSLDSEFHENASFVLSEIVELTRTYTESPLIVKLESEPVIQKLYKYILTDIPLGTSFLHGLTVIIKLLRRHKENCNPATKKTPLEELGPLFKESLIHTEQLNNLLTSQNAESAFTTTTGLLSPPLGFHKLKVIEFFADLINSRYLCIDKKFIELGILTSCLDLFFRYPWNNLLHSQINQICQIVLYSESENEADAEKDELKLSLLNDSKLLEKIIQADEDNTNELKQTKGIRFGYMGFLNSIAYSICDATKSNPALKQVCDDNPKWGQFVQDSLRPILSLESEPLGDFRLSLMIPPESADEDEPEYDEGFSEDYNNTGIFNTYNQNNLVYDDEDEEEYQMNEQQNHHVLYSQTEDYEVDEDDNQSFEHHRVKATISEIEVDDGQDENSQQPHAVENELHNDTKSEPVAEESS